MTLNYAQEKAWRTIDALAATVDSDLARRLDTAFEDHFIFLWRELESGAPTFPTPELYQRARDEFGRLFEEPEDGGAPLRFRLNEESESSLVKLAEDVAAFCVAVLQLPDEDAYLL